MVSCPMLFVSGLKLTKQDKIKEVSGVEWRGDSPPLASHVVWKDTNSDRDSPYSVKRLRLPSPGLKLLRLRTRRYVVHLSSQIKLTFYLLSLISRFTYFDHTSTSLSPSLQYFIHSSTNPYSSETKKFPLSNINSNSPKLKLRNQKRRSNSLNQLLTRVRLIGLQERI
jgi:hypothetical protein